MGAWGHLAFDNDGANDWAYGLDDVDDLSLVEEPLEQVEGIDGGYLDQDVACIALAACDVLARLPGNAGYENAYTEKVHAWVAAHPIKPPPEVRIRPRAAMDRVLEEGSELRELWEEAGDGEWRQGVLDLRRRLGG